MKWKLPPKIKVLEALGCISDERVKVEGNFAIVLSSSRNKEYNVVFLPELNEISSNDNASFYIGYLGYPAIAFLMAKGILNYSPKLALALKGIKWKDINVKFKNDFEKTEQFVLKCLFEEKGMSVEEVSQSIGGILEKLKKLGLNKPESIPRPPDGY